MFEKRPQREEPLGEVDHWLDRLAKLLALSEAIEGSVGQATIQLLQEVREKIGPRSVQKDADDASQDSSSVDVYATIEAFTDHYRYIRGEVHSDISRARDTLKILEALHSYFKVKE
jgi:hypothetical protein